MNEISLITGMTIAIVDDEPDLVELVSVTLRKNGFIPVGFNDAGALLKYLKSELPDMILLDLMLPDADGFDVCKYLKNDERYSDIPVIMLTAKAEESDKVLGLEIGADDYITKPFSPREMIARIRVVLRRKGNETKNDTTRTINDIEIDLQKYVVKSGGEKKELTTTEFKILKLLSERPGWVYTREQILEYLGVNDKGVLDRTVDVHIKNLREKLGESGKIIKNIRGVGYKIEA